MAAEIKPTAGLQRDILSDAIPLDTPYSMFIFPTTICNFRCVYCGHSLGKEEMRKRYGFEQMHMDIDMFFQIVEQIKQFPRKIRQISLTGHGEPLLNPNIAEMVRIIKEADITQRLEVITNASLLKPELAEKLAANGLDCLRVSIQGVATDSYRKMCGTNVTFEEILENLTYFSKIKNNTQLYVKVMDVALNSTQEQEYFYKSFSDIADRMYIETCRPVYSGVSYTEKMVNIIDRYGRSHPHREVCPLPFFMLGIFPDGSIVPCDAIYKPVVLGNITNISLREAWNGQTLRKFQYKQICGNRSKNEKCAQCCAPDDVSHPEDNLDHASVRLKAKWAGMLSES